ncbi:MAG TPA: bile acid:sodium symporter family protein [Planctomicrobium sp.]|nr:bile acid:sodium symporter family protein [Planctomicrobium sp.]
MKTKFRFDWFMTGMAVAVLLAWLFPDPGADGGSLQPALVTNLGVATIFFLHGISLSLSALKQGMLQWQQHLLVQSCVFLLFPIIGVSLYFLSSGWLPESLRMGFLFLCALPSTVSTSVALTATAYGNVPIALFSATISSLIGVALTPMWMGIAVDSSQPQGSLSHIVLSLFLLLVIPLIAGQMARHWLGDWGNRNKKLINNVDRIIILFLVYTSFCDSFQMGIWTRYGLHAVVWTVLLSLFLFGLVFFLVELICRSLKLSQADRIAVLFCGTKKSLATGIPMSQVMFSGNPALGLILLPIMVYHPMQLIICGILAGRWAKDYERTVVHSQKTDVDHQIQ